jgi:hypothetical protein
VTMAKQPATAKQWSAEAVEAALLAQGVPVAPGRAERLARGLQALLDASATDPLRGTLEFDADPAGFPAALQKCK